MDRHPVRLVVTGDLQRGRLGVLLRLLPLLAVGIVLTVWTMVAGVLGLVNWLSVAATGRQAGPVGRWLAAYVRWHARAYAYGTLVAGPTPFVRLDDAYPVDLQIDLAGRQRRLGALLRPLLAVPALVAATSLGGFFLQRFREDTIDSTLQLQSGGALLAVAVLGWLAALATGQMPEGLRNLGAWVVGYAAQALAYLGCLTDRYPQLAPFTAEQAAVVPGHPVALAAELDPRRSRLVVLFRLPLLVPHLVWLGLWSLLAVPVAVSGWLAALATGQLPAPLHRFLERLVRYQLHVWAFASLAANPFPGFAGAPGSYPIDLLPIERGRLQRGTVFVRLLLAIPASAVSGGLSQLAAPLAVAAWACGLLLGRVPASIRVAQTFILRYDAQLYAYLLLLTQRYPYAGPWTGDSSEPVAVPEPAGPAAPLEPAS